MKDDELPPPRGAMTCDDPPVPDRSRHLLPAFFALAFGWSWLWWLAAELALPMSTFLAGVLRIVASFGPSLAAATVLAAAAGPAATTKWLARCLRWRSLTRWLVLAFALPALLMSFACAVHVALGGSLAALPVIHHWWSIPANFALIFLFGGPLGEEFGWRGFALPVMQERLRPHAASALLGLAWSAWHLPLFFMSGTVQGQVPFWLFTLNAVPLSILFGWLFNRSRQSVVPALVFHTAVNGWTLLIPILPGGGSLRPMVIATLLMWLAAGACAADRTGMPARGKAERI